MPRDLVYQDALMRNVQRYCDDDACAFLREEGNEHLRLKLTTYASKAEKGNLDDVAIRRFFDDVGQIK